MPQRRRVSATPCSPGLRFTSPGEEGALAETRATSDTEVGEVERAKAAMETVVEGMETICGGGAPQDQPHLAEQPVGAPGGVVARVQEEVADCAEVGEEEYAKAAMESAVERIEPISAGGAPHDSRLQAPGGVVARNQDQDQPHLEDLEDLDLDVEDLDLNLDLEDLEDLRDQPHLEEGALADTQATPDTLATPHTEVGEVERARAAMESVVERIEPIPAPQDSRLQALEMTGRGKGGKGLGKGGAKRHRKVLRDNIQVSLLSVGRPDLLSPRASPSPPSGASPGGAASRGSPASSTRRPGASSRSSSRT